MLEPTCPASRPNPRQRHPPQLAGATASCGLTRAATASGCSGPRSRCSRPAASASRSTRSPAARASAPGPAKEDLYLAVAVDQLEQLAAQAKVLAAGDPATALFTQLSAMVASGAENTAVKSALAAAEFDLRTAAPDVAADLTRQVAHLLDRAQAAHAVRDDVTAEEVMALVAGAFAAIRHAGAEASRQRSAHIAQLILDGLRPQPGRQRRRGPR
jgi:hypothetical protein